MSAFPDGDNIFNWLGTVTGGKSTVRGRARHTTRMPAPSTNSILYLSHLVQAYEGLKYKLSLSFPSRYPYVPPTVKFVTPCYHPNVDDHGNICLDILKVRILRMHCHTGGRDEGSLGPRIVSGPCAVSLSIQEEWSALYDVRTILLSIQSLLAGR